MPTPAWCPGMYVEVSFTLKNPIGVQVPAAALSFRPKPQVAIIDDKNVVEFRDVKIGVDDGDVVQIEAGLKEGDKVALNLSSQIASGMKVDAARTQPSAFGKVNAFAKVT